MISSVPFPASAMSNMRLTMRDASEIDLQGGSLLGSVLHHDPVVAEGSVAGNPEASRCGLPHPPRDLLGQILAVELVHALDDGLHELAGGCVVGVLGDGDDADCPCAGAWT